MTVPPDFMVGFTCCSIAVLLYLLYEFIEAFKELVEVLKKFIEDE